MGSRRQHIVRKWSVGSLGILVAVAAACSSSSKEPNAGADIAKPQTSLVDAEEPEGSSSSAAEVPSTPSPETTDSVVDEWESSPDGEGVDCVPCTYPEVDKVVFIRVIGDQGRIWSMNPDGSDDVDISTTIGGSYVQASWSPDANKIAFVSDAAGTLDIYIMNLDGTDVLRLTSAETDELEPAWSPDGKKIAYTVDDGRGRYGHDIWVMDADGSNQTQLPRTELGAGGPAWSPDGRQIAFILRHEDPERAYTHLVVALMDRDGGNIRPLEASAQDVKFGGTVAWSPDGTRLVFECERLITAMSDGGRCEDTPLVSMRTDGTGLVNVTKSLGGDGLRSLNPDFSPDGKKIVFERSDDDSVQHLWVINADGSGAVQITSGNSRNFWPRWSPVPVNTYFLSTYES